jgi:hypothetical protein
MRQAIAADPRSASGDEVQVRPVAQLEGIADSILCPFALEVPADLAFWGQDIYRHCQDVPGLRQRVAAWGYATGAGALQVPIVWTARGPLYGEAIAPCLSVTIHARDGATPPTAPYIQPLHLSDRQRQGLYRLGGNLLRSLAAPPAVYLLQVDMPGDSPVFDRLWPFPTPAAIASLATQTPDLFAAHWRCLTGRSVRDIAIAPPIAYGTLL